MKLPSILTRTLLAGAMLTLATTASQAALITGGTKTATGTRYANNFMQGYDFVAVNDLSLTALGFWGLGANGLPGTFQLGVWDTTTQTLLGSAILNSADPLDLSLTVAGGNWRYETLGAPVALTASRTYTLAWQSGTASPSNADSLFINYPTLTTSPDVTVADNGRFLGTSAFTFPTSTTTAGDRFRGQANAQFAPVPEPTTALFGLALLGFCTTARRRRAQAPA